MRDAPLLDTQVSSTFTELNVRQDTGKPHFVRLHDSVVRDLERQLQGGREQSGILIGSIEGSGPCTIAVEEFDPTANVEERIRAGDGGKIVGFYRSHSRRDFAPESADRALFQRCFSRDARLLLLLKPPKTDVGTAIFFLGENGQLSTDRATVEFPFNLRELGAEESPAAAAVVEAAAKPASGGGLVWKLCALSVAVIASVVGFSGVFDSQKTQTQPPVAVEQPAIVEPPPAVEPPVAAVQSKKPKPAIPPAPVKAVKTIVTPPRVQAPPRKQEPVTMPVEQPVVVADNAAAKPAAAPQPAPQRVAPPPAPVPQPRTVTPAPPSAPPARPVQVPKPVEPTAPLIAPHATRQFAPIVPDNVRRSIRGEVVIKVRVGVDASGKVTAAEALSTGNAVAESLAGAAISAVKKWQFEPARRGEEKVAGEVALSFTFRK